MKITDIHPISKYLKPEAYNQNEENRSDMDGSIILFAVFAVLAGYLSWSCNTIQKEPVIIRIIYALFAAMFNWFYIILYFIFRHPCKECK
jgi:uncharacterized membrane-anchored protein